MERLAPEHQAFALLVRQTGAVAVGAGCTGLPGVALELRQIDRRIVVSRVTVVLHQQIKELFDISDLAVDLFFSDMPCIVFRRDGLDDAVKACWRDVRNPLIADHRNQAAAQKRLRFGGKASVLAIHLECGNQLAGVADRGAQKGMKLGHQAGILALDPLKRLCERAALCLHGDRALLAAAVRAAARKIGVRAGAAVRIAQTVRPGVVQRRRGVDACGKDFDRPAFEIINVCHIPQICGGRNRVGERTRKKKEPPFPLRKIEAHVM